MDQSAYNKQPTEKFGVDKCKEVHTPANESKKMIKLRDDDVFTPKRPYRKPVDALMYVTTSTRSKVAHAVSEVAKYSERYQGQHWIAVKRILTYSRATTDYSIVFVGKSKGELLGCVDLS